MSRPQLDWRLISNPFIGRVVQRARGGRGSEPFPCDFNFEVPRLDVFQGRTVCMIDVTQAYCTTDCVAEHAGSNMADYFSVSPNWFVVIEQRVRICQRKLNQAFFNPELLLFF